MRVSSIPRALVLSLFVILSGPLGFANELGDMPGVIPVGPVRRAADDLVYNGQELNENQAEDLRRRGVDISELNPENTDQWSSPAQPQSSVALDIQPVGEQFVSQQDSRGRVGIFRATVSKLNAQGASRTYRIVFSKKSHNYLLRKALLRKMGYQTQDIRHLRKFSIKFNGAFSRNQFVEDLKWATGDDLERWVL
ncbi:MAG TPA: hypothetical protein VM432_09300, partial [Bdellovibrionales bacterium]|nr:hypothetical protein [Bdellovibrionales bacterium]